MKMRAMIEFLVRSLLYRQNQSSIRLLQRAPVRERGITVTHPSESARRWSMVLRLT